jgi:hypothetical protein
MEPINPLLAPARGDGDQQTTRRASIGTGDTIGPGRLKSSPKVTTFPKVTDPVAAAPDCERTETEGRMGLDVEEELNMPKTNGGVAINANFKAANPKVVGGSLR